jgi:hypothetical protein
MKRRLPPRRKPSKPPQKLLPQAPTPPSPSGWQPQEIGALPHRASNAPPPTLDIVEPPKPTAGTAPGEIKWVNDQGQPVTFVNDKGEPLTWTTNPPSADPSTSARHQEMLSRIIVLERLLAEMPEQRTGIGHNRSHISEDEVREIATALIILKAQPIVPTVPDEARAAATTLKKIGEHLGAYLDDFLSETAKSAGKEFGKRVVQSPFWWALATTLMVVARSVIEWLR